MITVACQQLQYEYIDRKRLLEIHIVTRNVDNSSQIPKFTFSSFQTFNFIFFKWFKMG